MLGKSTYHEKIGLSRAVGQLPRQARFVCPKGLTLSVSLGRMMALPLLSASQKWDKKGREETEAAALFILVVCFFLAKQ